MKNIAIFGVPRSGTSWLGQIFNSSPQVAYRYQPIFAYSFKRGLSELSSSEDIQTFHRELLCLDDDFVCQKRNISGNPAPQFTKKEITHLVWKEVRHLNVIENLIRKSSTKVIGIIRHPCGVLKSWMQAPREFKADWDVQEEWRFASKKNDGAHDFYGYERWLSAANMFLRLAEVYPGQFRILIYESLLRDSKSTVQGLFEFVDLIL
ncbi:MAG: sulfotransferase, partial [Balneolaceae bacterium]